MDICAALPLHQLCTEKRKGRKKKRKERKLSKGFVSE